MIYRFEAFELDMDRIELRRDGIAVAVEPQVFALLALLVTNNERMVSKEEINEKIWGGRIVSESALSSRIKSVRQAVGDDGQSQRAIRTIHGQGFRFVAPLAADGAPVAGGAKSGEIFNATRDNAQAAPKPRRTAMSRPSVVVLPFNNMSGDAEQEHFSDGITEDITARLSKHRWLNVVARNTAFGYKGRAVDVSRIADELNVDYVVEGSVRRLGDRIRITAQLIDAHSSHHKWAERYDRDFGEVFAVQDEITDMIVARLEPEIGYAERQKVARAPRRDLQAWESYHLGVAHFFKFTAADNLEAQRLLQRSREIDPNFGEAHAWWGYATVLGMVYWDTEPSQALLDEALAATCRALELDDQNGVFYALKARVQIARCEYESALAGNETAIELNPTFAAAYCGLADTLSFQGRYEEAARAFKQAIDLSPNDPQRWAFLTYGALTLIFQGAFETAVKWTDRASEVPNCQYWATAHKAVALSYLDRPEEARATVAKLLNQKPGFSVAFAKAKLFYVKRPEQLALYTEGLRRAGIPEA